nr:translation initiation factor IF-2 N-terminal domain-containing protein [Actinomycetota bacterium]
MNKRVHEIAKQQGVPAKDVLARLQAAGVDVTASSSSVDEALARRVLARAAAKEQAAKAAAPN